MKKKLAGWIGMLGAVAAMQSSAAHAEAWGETDKLQDFVSRMDVLTNARVIDSRNLKAAAVTHPWASTYWPDNLGSVAWRYLDYATNSVSQGLNLAISGWSSSRRSIMDNGDYMVNGGRHKPLIEMSQTTIDRLSPAEKYDLMMGDENYTFWNKVIARVDQLGSSEVDLLAIWAGVCHGWSPASLTMDRPLHGVRVMSPLGREITFYPDDIKALAAFLWGTAFGTEGNAQNFTKVEGWQCQTGAHSNRYSRLYDPRCADVNPAFLHLTMVNQIGLNQHGFVMDRNYRAEVQNQPTYAYDFKYYKVSDRHPSPGMSLDQARVMIASSFWDSRKNYRSPRAVSLVGVEATLWYGLESYHPDHTWTDNPSRDRSDHLTIRYDLELDAADNIVGGEWREYDDAEHATLFEQIAYQHPDIIWLVPPKLEINSAGDFDIANSEWDGRSAVPAGWKEAAIKASSKHYSDMIRGHSVDRLAPQPLAKVVKTLIRKSREAERPNSNH